MYILKNKEGRYFAGFWGGHYVSEVAERDHALVVIEIHRRALEEGFTISESVKPIPQNYAELMERAACGKLNGVERQVLRLMANKADMASGNQ